MNSIRRLPRGGIPQSSTAINEDAPKRNSSGTKQTKRGSTVGELPNFEGSGGCRYDPSSRAKQETRRISALLWESFSDSPSKQIVFDPDGIAAAAAEAEAEERAEEWAEWRRDCGRSCKKSCLVLTIVGVVGTIIAAVAVLASFGAGSFNANPDVQEVCSKRNIKEKSGIADCERLCEAAYCCYLPRWDVLSCSGDRAEYCSPFIGSCPVLDSRAESDESTKLDEESNTSPAVAGNAAGSKTDAAESKNLV